MASIDRTEIQQSAGFALPIITGFFSLLGSSTIVYIMLSRRRSNHNHRKNKRRRRRHSTTTTAYDRLILGMSIMDIFSSTAVVLSTLPSPRDTMPDYLYGSWKGYGTIGTCTAQGFFYYVGMNGTTLYYCVLCIYYAIVITDRRNYSAILRRNTEIWLHCVPIVYCFSTGLFLAVTEYFNNAGPVCWISYSPLECRGDPRACKRGARAGLYRLIFAGIPVIGSFFVILSCMMILICTVQKQERKMQKYDYYFSNNNVSNNNNTTIENNNNNDQSNNNESRNNSLTTATNSSQFSPFSNRRTLLLKMSSLNSILNFNNGNNNNPNDTTTLTRPSQQQREKPKRYSSVKSRQRKRMQRTTQQGMMYILAYLITFVFGIANQLTLLLFKKGYWWLFLLQQATAPAQGLLNFFVYIRPQVIRIRRRQNNRISWFGAFLEAIWNSEKENERRRSIARKSMLAKRRRSSVHRQSNCIINHHECVIENNDENIMISKETSFRDDEPEFMRSSSIDALDSNSSTMSNHYYPEECSIGEEEIDIYSNDEEEMDSSSREEEIDFPCDEEGGKTLSCYEETTTTRNTSKTRLEKK